MFSSISRPLVFLCSLIGIAVLSAHAAAPLSTPPVGAMMQNDDAYDSVTAQNVVAVNPGRFLFRVKGPKVRGSEYVALLQQFVNGLAAWPGQLVYSPDVTWADIADWPDFDPTQPWKVFVDDLVLLNNALATSSHRFTEITIETEGSVFSSLNPALWPTAMRSYLNDQLQPDVSIGLVTGWTKLGAPTVFFPQVDHLYIENYNLSVVDATDPLDKVLVVDGYTDASICTNGVERCDPQNPDPGNVGFSIYMSMTPAAAAAHLTRIYDLKYPTQVLSNLANVYWLFSYEYYFLGTAAQDWTRSAYDTLVSTFEQELDAAGLIDEPLNFGVYDAAAAFARWNGQNVATSVRVNTPGKGSGMVASTPAGIRCGADCSESYPDGTGLTLIATPAEDSEFGYWTHDCQGTGAACRLRATGNQTVGAVFVPKHTPRYRLTVTTRKRGEADGIVVSTDRRIDCGPVCQAKFHRNTPVTLIAKPKPGSVFKGWRGGSCSGIDRCIVTLRRSSQVSALFEPGRHAITGAVSTPEHTALPHALVTIEGRGIRRDQRTDTEGRYRFHRLPPGRYTMVAAKPGYTFAPLALDLTLGQQGIDHLDFTGTCAGNSCMTSPWQVAFFLDDVDGTITDIQQNFTGAGVIGEFTRKQRNQYAASLHVGMTCALLNGPQTPWWQDDGVPYVQPSQVIGCDSGSPTCQPMPALAYPDEFPDPTEKIVYSQDLAYLGSAPHDRYGTNLSYAQAVTLLWAARQLLPATPIWPNMGHTLMLSEDFNVGDLKQTLAVKLPAAADWDYSATTFPAFLAANHLVDGLIAQEYTTPGQIDFDPAGLPYICQAETPNLPSQSAFCLTSGNGHLPYDFAIYLPDARVPAASTVSAVQAIANCPGP